MSFKIYVAGAWTAREEIKKYQKDIVDNIPGSVITHDWTLAESNGFADRTREYNSRNAELDLWKGVGTADCVIAIKTLRDYPYRGTEREIGFAQGRSIPVFILAYDDLDSYVCKNVFYHLTKGQKTYQDWKSLINDVKELAETEMHYGRN